MSATTPRTNKASSNARLGSEPKSSSGSASLPIINQPTQEQQQRMQEQFNQLVSEVRMLESYYQEIMSRQQNLSAALLDARSAIEAIDALQKSGANEILVPIGGGTLIPVTSQSIDKLIVSVGAGIAVEKNVDSAKMFLEARREELEKAITSLEGQRKEIGSRLEVGRATLQRITGSL